MYHGFYDFMFKYEAEKMGILDGTETHFNYHLNEYIGNAIFAEFSSLCADQDWSLHDAILGWEGAKHWDLWQEDWEYLCKSTNYQLHPGGYGLEPFPAEMLYWHSNGFYCEDCLEWEFDQFDIMRRGRSLAEELKLAKQRGKCYRTLPQPVIFCY